MPRGRVIDNRIWQSEKVSKWDYFTRLLFVGMVTNADDQGRGRAHSNLLASTMFPYDGVSSDEIEDALQKMVDSKAVIIYIPDGTPALYQIKKWWDYNTAKFALPSEYPAPPDWQDRWCYKPNYQGKLHYYNWPGRVDTTVVPTVDPMVSTMVDTTKPDLLIQPNQVGCINQTELVEDETDQETDQEIDLDLDQETAIEAGAEQPAAAKPPPRDVFRVSGRLAELGVDDPLRSELALYTWVTVEYINEWWAFISDWDKPDIAVSSLIVRLEERRQVPPDWRGKSE